MYRYFFLNQTDSWNNQLASYKYKINAKELSYIHRNAKFVKRGFQARILSKFLKNTYNN